MVVLDFGRTDWRSIGGTVYGHVGDSCDRAGMPNFDNIVVRDEY
jgi:hypothetical protein